MDRQGRRGQPAALNVETIDLCQAHKDDGTTPLEDTFGAFARLIEQGKARAIGASNSTAARLAAALETSARLGLPRFETVQPLCNLVERGIEADLLPLCRSREIGVIPYSSLASGFLAGKYRSAFDLGKSLRVPRSVAKYLTPRGTRVLDALDAVAARLDATPTQVALAWQSARPGITARSRVRLDSSSFRISYGRRARHWTARRSRRWTRPRRGADGRCAAAARRALARSDRGVYLHRWSAAAAPLRSRRG
jgi:diketogulonate reductase-like aldo/keto reductase